jgi:hypothetical protein
MSYKVQPLAWLYTLEHLQQTIKRLLCQFTLPLLLQARLDHLLELSSKVDHFSDEILRLHPVLVTLKVHQIVIFT